MFDSDYGTLTLIGKRFGVSCRVCGQWLADQGLREIGGSPSREAFAAGLVNKTPTNRGDGNGYFYVWHVRGVVELLEKAGHKQVEHHDDEPKPGAARLLIGPFSHRLSGSDGYELANGNGVVFGWIRGERVATFLVKLLNLLDKHGHLPASG